MNKSLVFFMAIVERIALICLIVSSVCLIESAFKYIFDYENFNIKSLFHLYGFIVANLVLLVSPQIKDYILYLEKPDKKE